MGTFLQSMKRREIVKRRFGFARRQFDYTERELAVMDFSGLFL